MSMNHPGESPKCPDCGRLMFFGLAHNCQAGKTKAGECKHEWGPVWPGPGQDDWDYECLHCNDLRTVADFWKEEPPDHPNPEARVWCRQVLPGHAPAKPGLVKLSKVGQFKALGMSGIEFFHHPGYIIEPPPTPDSSHVPDP